MGRASIEVYAVSSEGAWAVTASARHAVPSATAKIDSNASKISGRATPAPFSARSGSSRCSDCIYGTGDWSTCLSCSKHIFAWMAHCRCCTRRYGSQKRSFYGSLGSGIRRGGRSPRCGLGGRLSQQIAAAALGFAIDHAQFLFTRVGQVGNVLA